MTFGVINSYWRNSGRKKYSPRPLTDNLAEGESKNLKPGFPNPNFKRMSA